MKTIRLLFCALIISLGVNAQVIEHIYDFNSLSVGDLSGQDGWVTILYPDGPGDLQVDYANSQGDLSADGTLSLWYNHVGGRAATRKASANFDFDFTIEGTIELEFDMRKSHWGNFFGCGYDADGDGHCAPGLATEANDGGIHVNIASQNPLNNKIILPNGQETIFSINNDGWASYKMVMDFTANGGQGSVALFYKPGTTGAWIAVPEVQGLNMGLTPNSGNKLDHTTWDAVYYRSPGWTASLDNILVREPEDNGQLQFISFDAIPNKLTTSPEFSLNATASSSLPVEFVVDSGPATINGNVVTLDGTPGIVTIKASQAGDTIWAAAPDIYQSFEVVDPQAYQAELTIRRPANNTDVYMDMLQPILLVASAYIDHPDVLLTKEVEFIIDGQTMIGDRWTTGYNTAEWTPPAYGSYTMTVNVTTTGNVMVTNTVDFEVTQTISNLSVQAFDEVECTNSHDVDTGEFVFPTYVGAFNEIMANLDVTCPSQGCEPWDRTAYLEARGPTGQWVELFRYITPYGVECNHSTDLVDYSSILQGLVEMRYSSGVMQKGLIIDIDFDFTAGEPSHKYSWVDVIWRGTFPFGDYANLQPMDVITWNYNPGVLSSKLKILNTGHAWGDLNTGNAAEFYEATHKIKVNNDEFDQHLWVVCNPNPDNCQPQNGTWCHNRAGWCPGSISYVYEYDLTPYVNTSNILMEYEFDPGYVDLCHPNHPDCVTGVTCSDCQSTYNPNYVISGNLISYSNQLIYTSIDEEPISSSFKVELSPNPTNGMINISVLRSLYSETVSLQIFNANGQLMEQQNWDGQSITKDISTYPKGLYMVKIQSEDNVVVRKVILQ